MYKGLNSKLVLIFIVFILCVMVTVGVFLLNSIFNFYAEDFNTQITDAFESSVSERIVENLKEDNFSESLKTLLLAYSGNFGFDSNRVFYILDTDGNVLKSSDISGKTVQKSANLLSAMNGKTSYKQRLGAEYMDYAYHVSDGESECIIYIKDNLSKMKKLSQILFSIIIQSLLIGLIIAVILSFFLARAITMPIQNLTRGTVQIASGEYDHRLSNHSGDEIGVLTRNFNSMAEVIENTLAQVSEEKEKLTTILNCLEEGVCAFDENGTLMHMNPKVEKMLSAEREDISNFKKFTSKVSLTDDISIRDVKKSKNSLVIAEHTLNDSKGKEFIADIGFSAFSYDKKKTGIIVVIRDVTQRSLLEKSRREFVANVSHELRTPLTSIKGAAETISGDPDMPGGIRQRFLDILLNETDRMTRIVKDLLVLSRLDNRRMSWTPSEFSIYKSVTQVCSALSTDAKTHNHTLECIADENTLPKIYGDKERIEQVITNLAGNAIKYTPDGGKITVEAKSIDTKSVQITVTDNGIGIPKDDIPHLFERFYRVEKSRTSDAGGTGLGLSIAKEIIDAHGGKITVKSTEGEGTSITLILPIKSHIGEETTV